MALGRCLSPELRGRRARTEVLGAHLGDPSPDEAIVYLRVTGADGATSELRLCLTRSGPGWKIWDLERGEHGEVPKVLEDYLDWDSGEIWNDPDFGPIFASAPEYADLRKKYPRD